MPGRHDQGSHHEAERLAAVRRLGIVDTAPEPSFDEIARTAANLLDAEIGLVTFVDAERVFFKAAIGLGARESSRDGGFCPVVVATRETLIVEDAARDPRFADDPVVRGPLSLRFYAGTPVFDDAGRALGTVCVADRRPRSPDRAKAAAGLEALSRQVGRLLQLREALAVRTETEERLRASEELFRTAFEDAAIGMALVTVDGRIARANSAFAAMLGYSPEALVGRRVAEITHPDDVDGHFERRDDLIAGRRTYFRLEKRYLHRDGRVVWGQLSVSLFRGRDGAPAFFLSQIVDVTARKALEGELEALVRVRTAALEKANEELRNEVRERTRVEAALRESQERLVRSQKLEALGRFAGGVAHEFNNLLTVITGHAELLQEQGTGDGARQILAASERAARLTGSLLALGRRRPQEPRLVDLAVVLREQERLLRPLLGERLALELEIDADAGVVRIDPTAAEQIVINLVRNAVDAQPRGGAIRVALRPAPCGDDRREAPPAGAWTALSVDDDGHGIADDVLPQIFDPFFTTKEVGKGTGLGLATVHALAVECGGHVRVASRPGRGATFTVYFPRAVAPSGEADSTPPPTVPVRPAVPRATVVVAEDDSGVRDLVVRWLVGEGCRTFAAGDGVEATAAADALDRPLDLLITDVVMPRMNGPDLATRLRAARPDLPVVFMSAYYDRPGNAGLGSNAVFLPKPFTRAALAEAVRRALSARAVGASPHA
jgi:PAS domain S-box-containing protein